MFLFQIWHHYVNLSPTYLELLHTFIHQLDREILYTTVECTLCLGHPVYGGDASLKVTVYFCYCLQGTDIIICDGVYVLLYFFTGY